MSIMAHTDTNILHTSD